MLMLNLKILFIFNYKPCIVQDVKIIVQSFSQNKTYLPNVLKVLKIIINNTFVDELKIMQV